MAFFPGKPDRDTRQNLSENQRLFYPQGFDADFACRYTALGNDKFRLSAERNRKRFPLSAASQKAAQKTAISA
jgi:hypothetical protein